VSFIRPEASAALRRYGEPTILGAVTVGGIWKGWLLLDRGAWVGGIVLGIGVLAGLGLFGAVERALLAWRSRSRGPGMVSIHEGRIAYFGPYGGAVMALDALVSVELLVSDAGWPGEGVHWQLSDELGQQVTIPGGADGAAQLLDRLGMLPGFNHMAVVAAIGSAGPRRSMVWSRNAQCDRISP